MYSSILPTRIIYPLGLLLFKKALDPIHFFHHFNLKLDHFFFPSFKSFFLSLPFSAAFRGCTLNFYHLYPITWSFVLYKWYKHYVQAFILAARAESQKVQALRIGCDFGSQSRITEGTSSRYRLWIWQPEPNHRRYKIKVQGYGFGNDQCSIFLSVFPSILFLSFYLAMVIVFLSFFLSFFLISFFPSLFLCFKALVSFICYTKV